MNNLNRPDDTHLADDMIAAYLDRTLSAAEAREVEEHLARCAACRNELRAASRLLRDLPKRRRWRYLVPLAAAAVIGALLLLPSNEIRPPSRVLRTTDTVVDRTGPLSIEAVAPAPGALVGTEGVAFLWRSIDSDATYRITLSEEDGDVVWSQSTTDTTISLPTEIALLPDRVYLWYVDGLRRDVQSATSGLMEFRTPP